MSVDKIETSDLLDNFQSTKKILVITKLVNTDLNIKHTILFDDPASKS